MNSTAMPLWCCSEFPLPTGPFDYHLSVEGKAAGVIEVKKAGHMLSGVAEQTAEYTLSFPDFLGKWNDKLLFAYETTGEETYFRDNREPKPRSRLVFAFHQPATLRGWRMTPHSAQDSEGRHH